MPCVEIDEEPDLLIGKLEVGKKLFATEGMIARGPIIEDLTDTHPSPPLTPLPLHPPR